MAHSFSSQSRAVRYAAGALLAAFIPFFAAAAEPTYRSSPETDVPSFELWCLQIQLYPAPRCDARNSSDTQDYEHYRAMAEQLAQAALRKKSGSTGS